jgi:hypothetical protein
MTAADSAVDRRHRAVYHRRRYDAVSNDDCDGDDRRDQGDRVRRSMSG